VLPIGPDWFFNQGTSEDQKHCRKYILHHWNREEMDEDKPNENVTGWGGSCDKK